MFDFSKSVSEADIISFVCDDIPTEVETQSQSSRRRRAVVTRRLISLTGSAPMLLASASLKRSQQLLEEAFDSALYHFR